MNKFPLAAGLAATLLCIPLAAEAGPINRACMDSGRRGASSALCSCLDRVSKDTLTRSDRRKAARFFADPQKAQDMRQSDRPKDEAFWKRYQHFTDKAADMCG
ncbi:MAG: hypothetical protein CML66_18995 [Rhodobacteraceae bacterium]|nr:hypothetical protein [Paracoccaceae bacterium]MAY45538.1 hypothetical protein [Paracoccaceae bacterium]QEW21613.1 hypothetical protein LA6_003825 [Marinibacterium anthonyi]